MPPPAQQDLVQLARHLLDDNPWETYCVGATGTDDQFDVPDGTAWDQGAVGEFQDDGEQFLIRSIAGNTITAKRGHRGTTPSNHAANTIITREPVFSFFQIIDSIERVIEQLWPYVYKVVEDTVTPSNNAVWFDLAADALALIAVSQLHGTPPRLARYGENGSGRPVRMERGLPTSLCASGIGLEFSQGFFHASNAIYVRYAAKLTTQLSGQDYVDLEDDGLWKDVIGYGATARLLSSKEIPRVTQEDTNMGDTTVSIGSRQQMGQVYYQMHVRLRNQLQEELKRTSPFMEVWHQ